MDHCRQDGYPVAPPRSLDVLLADPEVQGAMRNEGAWLRDLAVPMETA